MSRTNRQVKCLCLNDDQYICPLKCRCMMEGWKLSNNESSRKITLGELLHSEGEKTFYAVPFRKEKMVEWEEGKISCFPSNTFGRWIYKVDSSIFGLFCVEWPISGKIVTIQSTWTRVIEESQNHKA